MPAGPGGLSLRSLLQPEDQQRGCSVCVQLPQLGCAGAEQFGDCRGVGVAHGKPNDLRRRSGEERPLTEVVVLRCDDVAVRAGELPDLVVAASAPRTCSTCMLLGNSGARSSTTLALRFSSTRSSTQL